MNAIPVDDDLFNIDNQMLLQGQTVNPQLQLPPLNNLNLNPNRNLVKGGFLNHISMAHNLLSLVPVRKKFSNADEKFLQKYGNMRINRMRVCREPIKKYVGIGLNFATLGIWEKKQAELGYDKLFHLFLLIDIIDGTTTRTVILEKNDTPHINLYTKKLSQQTEYKFVRKQYNGTINSLLTATQAEMGTAFWVYDPFRNNCQDFLLHVLGDNGLLDSDLEKFIKQNVEGIVNETPEFSQHILRGITDTSRRIKTLVGQGLNSKLLSTR